MASRSAVLQCGSFLRNHIDEVIQRWEEKVCRKTPAARKSSRTELRNALPRFLEQLASGLEAGEFQPTPSLPDFKEVLNEYAVLRETLFEFLDEVGPIATRDRDMILTAIECAMADAAVRFADKSRARLQSLVRDLENERELRERVIAALSHDLRTPLTAARMNAQLIGRTSNAPDSLRKRAHRITANLDRMDQMIRDLLDASRLRAGEKLSLELGACDLGRIARETVEELIAIHGVRFLLDAPLPVSARANAEAVRRILENLCNNAIKYGSRDALVRVSVANDNGAAVLAVHNEGNPIPETDQAALFAPYRRTDSAQRGGERGWGLGLMLVKGLAESQGGSASVRSSPEEGTTFYVKIPAQTTAAETAANLTSPLASGR